MKLTLIPLTTINVFILLHYKFKVESFVLDYDNSICADGCDQVPLKHILQI